MKTILYIVIIFSFISKEIYAKNQESFTQLEFTVNNKNYQFKTLIVGEDLPSSEGQFLIIPDKGLFFVVGNEFYSLDEERCPDIAKFLIKDSFNFEYTILSGNDFLVKNANFLMRIHEGTTTIEKDFDTETFFVYPGAYSQYHIVLLEKDGVWGWYSCDGLEQTCRCMLRTKELITGIYDAGEVAICTIENKIYFRNGKKLLLVYELPDLITCGTLTDLGLFMTTTDALYLFDGTNPPIKVLDSSYNSVYYDGGVLYIILNDGTVLKTKLT